MTSERLNVTLPRELMTFVTAKVRSGEYEGKDEVIRDSLELLKSLEGYRAHRFQRLREAIQVGLDQADMGLCRPWDKRAMDRIKAKGRRLLAARKNGKS